jgi:hypothetical protein
VVCLQDAWVRVASTVFNGASNVSQAGGIACLKVIKTLVLVLHTRCRIFI